ncbi:hypothetical protein BBJ28_00011834, partial [Nothophytophthora sp. Chile5]
MVFAEQTSRRESLGQGSGLSLTLRDQRSVKYIGTLRHFLRPPSIMDDATYAPYAQALASGSTTAAEAVQQLCQDHGLDRADGATYLLAALAKQAAAASSTERYVAPLVAQQQREDARVAHEHHQERSAAVSRVVASAVTQQLLHDDNPLVNLFSWDAYMARLANLRAAFPEPEFNHALAVKANPTRGLLRGARAAGFGAECASIAEAKHALSLGFEPRSVVYDSPCKTLGELREMLRAGVYINLDNEEEIRKVNQLFSELGDDSATSQEHAKQIGLRINPVVGGGTIDSTSTATVTSKFGLPLTAETKPRLLAIFEQNPWLQGVHVHVGSQGCP